MQTAKGAESWNSHPGRMPGSLNIPSTANTAARSPVVVISIVFLLFFMDIPPWALRAASKFSLYGMAAPTSYAHIRRHPGKINGSGAGSPQAPLCAATLRRRSSAHLSIHMPGSRILSRGAYCPSGTDTPCEKLQARLLHGRIFSLLPPSDAPSGRDSVSAYSSDYIQAAPDCQPFFGTVDSLQHVFWFVAFLY